MISISFSKFIFEFENKSSAEGISKLLCFLSSICILASVEKTFGVYLLTINAIERQIIIDNKKYFQKKKYLKNSFTKSNESSSF